MINFCTLFNSHYLSRGLNLYFSLKKTKFHFHIYIYAFDDITYEILNKLNLSDVTVVSLGEFEDAELLNVKKYRKINEYCWTCTPSVIKHSIEKYNLPSCTYIDADLYFFNNPNIIFDEIKDNSILLTEHRYTKEYDQTEKSGIYCVQFMFFKNDCYGMKALNWWRNACIDWCYARHEDGKFGDQKYLDDWLTRFEKVHVLENPGGGVAPWNIQQYPLSNEANIIFYHFHGLKVINEKYFILGDYDLSESVINLLYKPYIENLNEVENMLESKIYSYKRRFSFSHQEKNIKFFLKKFLVDLGFLKINSYHIK